MEYVPWCISQVLYHSTILRGSAPCGNKYGTVPWDFGYGAHWFTMVQYHVVCTVLHITGALPWYSIMRYSGTAPYPKSHGALPGGKNVVLFYLGIYIIANVSIMYILAIYNKCMSV